MKTLKNKTAVVTGGAGFIGSHLCDALLAAGAKVISIDDFSTGKKENIAHLKSNKKFRSYDCDLTDFKKTENIFKRNRVDIIFHEAASKKTICLKDPKRDLEVNGKGTLGLLQIAHKYNVKKFVHASTGSVYGEPVKIPQDETHPLNPTSYYGVSKLAGDRYVMLFNHLFDMDTTVLRYFHVYGPRQEYGPFGGVVAIFMRNLIFNQPITVFGTGKQERSFTYVDDVVKANLIVATNEKTKGQVYNCASGLKVTINELISEIVRIYNPAKKPKIIKEDWTPGDIKEFDVDNRKIGKLGMKFNKNILSGLKPTLEYFEEVLEKHD